MPRNKAVRAGQEVLSLHCRTSVFPACATLVAVNVGITCYPTYGGSGIVATELGMELAARGHEVHFITYANPIRLDPGTPRIHYHEVDVSNYPLFQYPPYCLALASRMADVAEAYALDLLHVHYAIPHSISARLAQQMLAPKRRLPFITTLHGTDITLVGTDSSYFSITKFSIEQSDGITAISDYLRHQTVDVFGVNNQIRVIKNFVNCDLYHPDNAKTGAAAYSPDGEKLLIHLSNFRPVKRVLDCIRILAEVRKRVPARLLMVGDGPDRGTAEHLAYVRPSWRREFLPLRTWGDKEDRTYKDLDRLLVLLRDDFGYRGFIGLYMDADPDLARYRALSETEEAGEQT